MQFPRRQLLKMLPFAVATDFSFARTSRQLAAQAGKTPADASSAEVDQPEKVTGIGGLFFRAQDPKTLAQWYQQHLGISLTPSGAGDLPWRQEAGPTSFTPFPEKTKYFGDLTKGWMINFRVRNLDRIAAQLQAAGISVEVDPTAYPNVGRFARLHDPEGNPIELWQPAA